MKELLRRAKLFLGRVFRPRPAPVEPGPEPDRDYLDEMLDAAEEEKSREQAKVLSEAYSAAASALRHIREEDDRKSAESASREDELDSLENWQPLP